MAIQQLFISSNEHLGRVVDQIRPDQWALMLPERASRNPQDLRAAIAYHAFDDAWVPDVLAGRTAEEVGVRFEPILDSADPAPVYRDHNQRARDAVAAFDDLEAVTHLSYGDFPAREFLQHVTSFRIVRTFDVARLIGVDPAFEPDFLRAIESEYEPLLEQYRAMGVFPDPIIVDDAAPLGTRVMAMFGRD
ncbi:hypothetical protein IWX81_002088 [Salinibacterium sp. CAN_S4]|uniref:hypothetical protein n=1 Tax=Salinibacterium sp. CAN_S4 TaxID=2787727 RepID=UPI0018F0117B